MKKNLDNFDDLVKNKLDGLDFSFNEANWEKASQMIEATRPAKKPFANLLLISSIVLTGALIIGSAYYFSSGSTNSDVKNIAQNNSINENSNTNSIIDSETKNLTSTNNLSEEKNQTEALSNSKEENKSTEHINSSASSEIKSKTSNVNSDKKENKAMLAGNSRNDGQETVGSSQKTINSGQSPVGSNQEATGSGNNNNASIKSQTHNNEPGLANVIEESSKHKSKLPEEKTFGEEKTSSNKSGTVYQPIGKTNPENEVKENTITSANEPTTEEKELIEIPKEQLVQTTVEHPDTASTEIAKKDYVKLKHHSISLEGGAINSFGWAVNGVRNGNSVSPIAGINYMYNFTDKSSLLVGFQYNSISNLTESNVSFSVTSYGFGVNNNVTTYKIIGLQYLTTPIKYIHKLDKNNAIGVGLNMTYLLNVKNKIETNNIVESNVQTITTKYDNGYGFDKMNRYNAQFALSYTRKISKNLGFNVELNQSLQNVFKDYNYFGVSNKNSKPTTLKLSFTYTIFNK